MRLENQVRNIVAEARRSGKNKNMYRGLIERLAANAYMSGSGRYTASQQQAVRNAMAQLNQLNRRRVGGGPPAPFVSNVYAVRTPAGRLINTTKKRPAAASGFVSNVYAVRTPSGRLINNNRRAAAAGGGGGNRRRLTRAPPVTRSSRRQPPARRPAPAAAAAKKKKLSEWFNVKMFRRG